MQTKIKKMNIGDADLMIVKIGSDARPATMKDIKAVESQLKKLLGKKFPNLNVIVTHHNFNVELHCLKNS